MTRARRRLYRRRVSRDPRGPTGWRLGTCAWLVFGILLFAYVANGDYLPGNDARPSIYLPVAVLNFGSLSFSPSQFPSMFQWRLRDTAPPELDAALPELIRTGRVQVDESAYYLTPSVRPGVYVSTFGPAPGLLALPVVATLRLVGWNPADDAGAAWFTGKLVAALLVAGSGVWVFLASAYFCTRREAVIVALAYGLGTCVWSTASQTLWQHGPDAFFLALGAWLLIRTRLSDPRSAAWCGAAFAAATACRPTSAVMLAAGAGYLFLVDRRALVRFVAGASPIACGLLFYNAHYLGSPWTFGQAVTGTRVALAKTESDATWTTPLWVGGAGLLVSPSRGLLVFSPFIAFAAASIGALLRDVRCQVLWPIALGAAGLFAVACKWFDWWGGWSFGYRPIVDTMPLLAVLLAPAMGWLGRRQFAAILFGVLVGWSFLVQVVGAFAYDLTSWNAPSCTPHEYVATLADGSRKTFIAESAEAARSRAATLGATGLTELLEDVDRPEFRRRLWSLRDNEIGFYLTHWAESRRHKESMIASDAQTPR